MRIRRILIVLSFCWLSGYSISDALNLEISSLEYENGITAARLFVSDSLPLDLEAYIEKGVPVSFEYELELWESRAGWLDRQLEKKTVTHKLRYDTWQKEYVVITRNPDITIENSLDEYREVSDLVKSSGNLEMEQRDTTGEFYITGKLVIRTMSLSNLREVESWLRGELSGAKKPDIEDTPDKFGEFLFNTALKISGLKNITEEIRTPFFIIRGGKAVYLEE